MIKVNRFTVLAAGYFALFAIIVVAIGVYWYGYERPPTQPIAFSHRIHVSKVGLACNFCHIYADKSKRAGVPSLQKCMSCHSVIATERPEIKKLHRYWNDKEPVPWVRVHSLPEYVYFTHKRHIKANIKCTRCHGDVQATNVIRRVSSLKMGWCVQCHRQNGAPTDCTVCHK